MGEFNITSHNSSNKEEVIEVRKVHNGNKLGLPAKIRNMLWLTNIDDKIEYVVNWATEKLYIRKKKDISFPQDDDEVLEEVNLGKDIYKVALPPYIMGLLWIQVGEFIEYVKVPSNNQKIHIRKKQ